LSLVSALQERLRADKVEAVRIVFCELVDSCLREANFVECGLPLTVRSESVDHSSENGKEAVERIKV